MTDMNDNELLAALKALPAANSPGIRSMPQDALNALNEACRSYNQARYVESYHIAVELAGGNDAWAALPFGCAGPLRAAGQVEMAKRNPLYNELTALIGVSFQDSSALTTISRELRRRRLNETRTANTSARAAHAVPAGTYAVGEQVQVHAFGHWYKGEVVKLGRTGKVTVRYTSGTGVTREKAVASDLIRKVEG
jgi:hypothetical protein